MANKKMLSPRQYAAEIERPYTTVMTWLQGGLLPTAKKQETPTGHYWEIPEGTPPPDLKPGPKKKDNAVDAVDVSPPVIDDPANKPVKKRPGKKGRS